MGLQQTPEQTEYEDYLEGPSKKIEFTKDNLKYKNFVTHAKSFKEILGLNVDQQKTGKKQGAPHVPGQPQKNSGGPKKSVKLTNEEGKLQKRIAVLEKNNSLMDARIQKLAETLEEFTATITQTITALKPYTPPQEYQKIVEPVATEIKSITELLKEFRDELNKLKHEALKTNINQSPDNSSKNTEQEQGEFIVQKVHNKSNAAKILKSMQPRRSPTMSNAES